MDLGIERPPRHRLRLQQGARARLRRGAGRGRCRSRPQCAQPRCAGPDRRGDPERPWRLGDGHRRRHHHRRGREAVLAACPDPDILVNNAGGPPPGDFRDWSREDWLAALDANMLTPIELIKATVDGMMARGFGRIVNITSSSVKAPIEVLGLSNGARSGLTGFVAGIARKTVRHNVTINNLLPGSFATDRLESFIRPRPRPASSRARPRQGAGSRDPRRPLRPPAGVRRGLRLPLLDPCRLCHRPELAARRRGLSRDVLRQLSLHVNPTFSTAAYISGSAVALPLNRHSRESGNPGPHPQHFPARHGTPLSRGSRKRGVALSKTIHGQGRLLSPLSQTATWSKNFCQAA